MASPDIIDVSTFLNPISDDAPTGTDQRDNPSTTSNYQVIKLERNNARAAERQSLEGFSQEAYNHWLKIVDVAPDLLTSESKDLEVACWYAEAMVRVYGFAGLRDAFKLIEGLIDNFWDNLFEMPDEFGMETRVSCLAGLNGEGSEGVLIAPIRKVFITEGYSPGPFGLWQYLMALDTQKIQDQDARQKKIANIGFGLDDIEKAIEDTSVEYLVNLRDDISACMEVYTSVGTKLDELCGIEDAPSIRSIINILEECLGAVKHLGRFKIPAEEDLVVAEDETMTAEGTESSEGGASAAAPKPKGPIATREDAFKQIQEVAAYFRKNEPHSPVSYMLEKAIKWGNMPLGDLIGELISDQPARERYTELTGVDYENN